MNANELLRKLKKLGAEIDASHGKGGHVAVLLNGRVTYVPLHGGKREIPTGTLRAILRQLELSPRDI